jgi:hypothetical protein
MLPVTTTTVTITRPAGGDPYETGADSAVASGVAAHIGQPSGSEIARGGELERVDAVLLAAAGIDLLHTDEITDETTDATYRVAWVEHRQGLGLDHVKAGLTRWDGGSNG